MVACEPIKKSRHFIENPILIAEILSPCTERADRIEKLAAYSHIPSLQEYVLVTQDAPKIEVFRRSEGWRREEFYREHTITLASVEMQLPVNELYARIGF
jgi:Uma2 family endonuclease